MLRGTPPPASPVEDFPLTHGVLHHEVGEVLSGAAAKRRGSKRSESANDMTIPPVIQRWHGIALDARDAPDGDWRERLGAILAEDCVFESPVVHTPQVGRTIVEKYLLGALSVLNTPAFRYGGEWFGGASASGPHPSTDGAAARDSEGEGAGSAVLEFHTEIDGIRINGVDIISWASPASGGAGLITHFKVMLRPLKAINIVHQKMGEYLMGRAAAP